MKKKAREEVKKVMIDTEKMMTEMKKLEVQKQEKFKVESSRELKWVHFPFSHLPLLFPLPHSSSSPLLFLHKDTLLFDFWLFFISAGEYFQESEFMFLQTVGQHAENYAIIF